MKINIDYEKAKLLGFTSKDRWTGGIEHHPLSKRLMNFLVEHDYNDYNDYFGWRVGGDGDNGESLMFEMDAFFEMLDTSGQSVKEPEKIQPIPAKPVFPPNQLLTEGAVKMETTLVSEKPKVKTLAFASVLLSKHEGMITRHTHTMHWRENVSNKNEMQGIAWEAAIAAKPGFAVDSIIVHFIELDKT